MPLLPQAFVEELDAQNRAALARIAARARQAGDEADLASLLQEVARLELGVTRAPGC